jgi:cysteine synthase A
MACIAADVTWLIGHTPLVELPKLSPQGTRIVAKLEGWNPSGSNKDRAALGMIQNAIRSGFLEPGGTIVECSSGDLGLAIAMVGRRLGYRVLLTMPEWQPESRLRLLRALGAEVVMTPAETGMRGAMARAEAIAKQTRGAVCLQAFSNRSNPQSHVETTAREIWEGTDGRVRAVVVPIGTGGTAAGCASFFRGLPVSVIGVEPAGSPLLTAGRTGQHDIPGLGAGFIPEILVPSELAETIAVEDREAAAGMRALAREESLLLGPASGAVVHAAATFARRPNNAGQLIVAILPDLAERYIDHRAMSEEA